MDLEGRGGGGGLVNSSSEVLVACVSSVFLLPSRFLFHGDGRAIAMDSQTSQSTYAVPRSSLASVDSQPHSSNKRSSIPSNYHNQMLARSKSQDHDSGFHSIGSGRTPPLLAGPPVRLDKHPSMRRKRDSDPGVFRRSNSMQSPSSSYNDKEMSDPMFDCDEGSLSRRTSHSDSPPDESEGYVTGHMDGDSAESSNRSRLYDEVREGRNSDGHPYYIPRAPETNEEEEYMRMIHPKHRNDGYVFMKPANSSPQKSSTMPVPMPQHSTATDEYSTLQHFQGKQPTPRASSSLNYEALPTIAEKQGRGENYENHPLPQDLRGVVPRNYQPSYENHERPFLGQRGSRGQESYEYNVPRSSVKAVETDQP